MKEIIQLSKHEYNELLDKATLNEKEIEQRALELYQEKGSHKIKIQLETQYDELQLHVKSHVRDVDYYNENKFTPALSDTKLFIEYLEQLTNELLRRKYGKIVETSKLFKAELNHNRTILRTFKLITYMGWFLTIVLMLAFIFK